MDVQPQGVHAPGVHDEHIEPETLLVASLLGPPEPGMDEIGKHSLLHDPPMPWCDICISSKKDRDVCHTHARSKVLPVSQSDFAVVGTRPGEPHFDLMVAVDVSTGATWASAVLIKGKEDPYIVASIVPWLSEFGHSKIIKQSDGEQTSEVVMRMVQPKVAMMEKPV